MNEMIVCTCDTCGKVVEQWSTLNVTLNELNEHRDVCNDCKRTIQKKFQNLLDEITVTGEKA